MIRSRRQYLRLALFFALAIQAQCRQQPVDPVVDAPKKTAPAEPRAAIPSENRGTLDGLRATADPTLPTVLSMARGDLLRALEPGELVAVLEELAPITPVTPEDDVLVGHCLDAWIARAPGQALPWLVSRPHIARRHRNATVAAIGQSVALDAPMAVEQVKRLRDPEWLDAAWAAWAAHAPAAAFDARRLELSPRSWRGFLDEVRGMMMAAAASKPVDLMAWICGQADAALMLEDFRYIILGQWVAIDPAGAAAWILGPGKPAGFSPDEWMKTWLTHLPSINPEAIKRAAVSLPAGLYRSQAMGKAAAFSARQDRDNTRLWIDGLPSASDQISAMKGLAHGQAGKGKPNDSLPSGVPPPGSGDPIIAYVRARAVMGQKEAFAWAAALEAPAYREKALFAAVLVWAETDRPAAENAIQGLSLESDRQAARAGMR